MKKIISAVLAMTLLLSGCGSPEPEGITLSKENYDMLTEAKEENFRLKSEIEYLEKRLEDLTGEKVAQGTETSEDTTNQDTDTSSEATEADATTEATEESTEESTEEAEEGFTEEEIGAMSLSLYQDDYGYYGYKNEAGEIVIEADFDTATGFSNGLSSVTSGGKSGTVSNRGVISWTSSTTYKKAVVKQRNDVKEGSSFAKFLESYRKALDERDETYIKAHTHPNIKISFGGHSGWDGLVDYWKLDEGSEGFYKMMKTTLKYGAVDTTGGQGNAYTAPYVFTDFPSDYDAFSYGVVVGSEVNIRNRPTTDSEVVAQVSYEVLQILEAEKDDWAKVQLPDGTRGYIYGTYLWSPIGYRASFTKVDNTWLLDFFVNGD